MCRNNTSATMILHNTFVFIVFCILEVEMKLLLQEKLVRTVDVQAVEGMKAQFPCELVTSNNDKVYMVFWFKDDAGIPLYSFDVRGKPLAEARHWSAPEVFGPRAHFATEAGGAALVVRDVMRRDEGVYRCRVDFRNTQTMSFRYNLTVVVPPEQPVVVDRWGRILNTSQLGPQEEGDDVLLTCRVLGGRPEPTVRWLVNGVLVDEEYEHNTGDVIENRLLWPAVRRLDYGALFTCQAANSLLVEPREVSLVLDMFLRPLTIEITNTQSPLVAEKRYEITCTTAGSRPNAVITWYKGKRQLKRTKEENRENVTISELSFVPTTDDDGKPITCRAENPNVTGLFLETSWTINVVYPPQVTLRLGSTLSSDDIKEGDDVYFECHVQANPPWRKLSWMHNDVTLAHNATARVIRSNQSLVLQKVTRHSSGRYACSALNAEGETVSNELQLRVKYAPSCRHQGVAVVGASRGESVVILCEVDADPPARTFKWKFNNSGETLDVGADRYTSNGSASSLKYTPVADLDYGTLSCTASNDIGFQTSPCVFQMVAAGKPHPVRNCSLSNQTLNSVEVFCLPGFDGGLPQHFVLEVYSSLSDTPRYNMTSDEPMFFVSNLEPDITFKLKVFAVNSKGRGISTILEDILFRDAEKITASRSSLSLSPALGAAGGAACTLAALVCAVAWRARRRARPPPAGEKLWPAPAAKPAPPPPAPREAAGVEGAAVDDREPDLIPANYSEPTPTYARPIISAATSNVASPAQHLPPAHMNGPGSSWTWSARPKELHLTQARLGEGCVKTSTLARSVSGDAASRASLVTTQGHVTELNVEAIKEKLLDNRIPESCV